MGKPDMAASLARPQTSPDELIYGPEAVSAPRPAPAPMVGDQLASGLASTGAVPKVEQPMEPHGPAPAARAVFTSQLNPDLYRRVRQYEYWAGLDLNELLSEALEAYLVDKPEAGRELPPKVAAKKLKALLGKSAGK
ncbi:hypothetical protein JAO77_22480 [Hymenobacter sp. BT559]|nr:hypothetical protein [Hymenobacter sp. BT559]